MRRPLWNSIGAHGRLYKGLGMTLDVMCVRYHDELGYVTVFIRAPRDTGYS